MPGSITHYLFAKDCLSSLNINSFENIIKNAEKYSNSDSTFKIIVESGENNIYIFFINKCKCIEEKDKLNLKEELPC